MSPSSWSQKSKSKDLRNSLLKLKHSWNLAANSLLKCTESKSSFQHFNQKNHTANFMKAIPTSSWRTTRKSTISITGTVKRPQLMKWVPPQLSLFNCLAHSIKVLATILKNRCTKETCFAHISKIQVLNISLVVLRVVLKMSQRKNSSLDFCNAKEKGTQEFSASKWKLIVSI